MQKARRRNETKRSEAPLFAAVPARATVRGGHQRLWIDHRSHSRSCGSFSFFFFSFLFSPRLPPYFEPRDPRARPDSRNFRARRSGSRSRDMLPAFGSLRSSPSPSALLAVALLAALTLPVDAATAGTITTPSAPVDASTRPPSSTAEPADATGGKETLADALRYSSLAEGGPILMSSSRHEATTETNRLDDNKARDNAPKERYASRMGTVVARKGVDEKIKARKGVQEDVASTKSIDQNVAENVETENVSLTRTTLKNTKSIVENNIVNETAHITSETSNVNNTNLNSTNPSHSAGSLNHNINSNASTAHETASLPEITNNVTTPKASTHIEKHIPKPKPTVTTVDGPEINESIPPSRTKNPPLGMPRKVDYIVPVIITIIALPILGAAIVVLYRQGQDCWDKRHYRRMDFLIDGMYND